MSSDEKQLDQIPALRELGREYSSAIRASGRSRVIPKGVQLALPVLAILALLVAVTPPGRAFAERVGEAVGIGDASPEQEEAAIASFCDDLSEGCTIVDGYADPEGGGPRYLVTPGDTLATAGRPPSECPEAAAAYDAAGMEVDAFVGPCPPPERWPDENTPLPPSDPADLPQPDAPTP